MLRNVEVKDRRMSTNQDKSRYLPLNHQNTFMSQATYLEGFSKAADSSSMTHFVSPYKRSAKMLTRS